jgi:hypothetical protein
MGHRIPVANDAQPSLSRNVPAMENGFISPLAVANVSAGSPKFKDREV